MTPDEPNTAPADAPNAPPSSDPGPGAPPAAAPAAVPVEAVDVSRETELTPLEVAQGKRHLIVELDNAQFCEACGQPLQACVEGPTCQQAL